MCTVTQKAEVVGLVTGPSQGPPQLVAMADLESRATDVFGPDFVSDFGCGGGESTLTKKPELDRLVHGHLRTAMEVIRYARQDLANHR